MEQPSWLELMCRNSAQGHTYFVPAQLWQMTLCLWVTSRLSEAVVGRMKVLEVSSCESPTHVYTALTVCSHDRVAIRHTQQVHDGRFAIRTFPVKGPARRRAYAHYSFTELCADRIDDSASADCVRSIGS